MEIDLRTFPAVTLDGLAFFRKSDVVAIVPSGGIPAPGKVAVRTLLYMKAVSKPFELTEDVADVKRAYGN
jgi:hypothetical protein